MHKLFLDANIFFAATYSASGASRFLFKLAEKNKIELISNEHALKEARKNIIYKLGKNHLPEFYKLTSALRSVEKTRFESITIKYNHLITEKDLPILLGAIRQKADFLITLDKKHFKTEKLLHAKLPFKIMSPGEYLKSL